MSVAINCGRLGINNEEFPSIKSPEPLILWSHMVLQDHVNYFSCCITTTTRPTKIGKVVTYYEKLQPIKSHNPLNTWSCEVM